MIYQGRNNLDAQKAQYAQVTEARTLADAVPGADIFLGLSAAGALTPEMVKGMADKPLILALANPEPEIRPEAAKAVRPDAIIATGRSDYRTRSTTSCASRSSSAARSMSARPRSTRR